LQDCSIRTLQDLIQFNKDHAEKELPTNNDNQQRLEGSQASNLSSEEYDKLFKFMRTTSRKEGIDKILQDYDIDVILGPGNANMHDLAAASGESFQ
jgi:amidase